MPTTAQNHEQLAKSAATAMAGAVNEIAAFASISNPVEYLILDPMLHDANVLERKLRTLLDALRAEK